MSAFCEGAKKRNEIDFSAFFLNISTFLSFQFKKIILKRHFSDFRHFERYVDFENVNVTLSAPTLVKLFGFEKRLIRILLLNRFYVRENTGSRKPPILMSKTIP